MAHNISKKYIILLISGLLLSSLFVLACADGYFDASEDSMFTPDVIQQPVYSPFFRDPYSAYDGSAHLTKDTLLAINIAEWSTYFNGKVPAKTIAEWLYNSSYEEIDTMIFTLQGKTLSKQNRYLNNPLRTVEPSSKAIGFLYFVGFARRNEPIVTFEQEYEWNGNDEVAKNHRDAKLVQQQLKGGLKLLAGITDPFLRERYLFQIERLYFFNNDYSAAVSFFESKQNYFTSNNTMKWRTMCYAAGALYKQKQFAKANYWFSQVYANCDLMKTTAQYCFHPQEDSDWAQSLALAKTKEEKIALWHIFGTYADELRAMKEIYALDPKSPMLDLLLVRAINIQEEHLAYSPSYSLTAETEYGIDSNYTALQQFVKNIADKGLTKRPSLWYMASAYLSYWANDFSTGDQHLALSKNYDKDNSLIVGQLNIISVVGKMLRTKKIDLAFENSILEEVNAIFNPKYSGLRVNYAQSWIRVTLCNLYTQKGEYEKAEIVKPNNHSKFYTNERIEKILAYYDNPSKSPLQQFFMTKTLHSKSDYADLLGIRYAQSDELEKALNYFKMPYYEDQMLYGNPFTIHIKDCHDCDHGAVQKVKYSKQSFIEKLVEMKTLAQTKPAEAAQNYFLVANGFYNMTYYGNARVFYSNSIYSYTEWNEADTGDIKELDCSVALKYYLLAREKSTDKEFKAKCTFMAAKCEQNNDFGGSFLDENDNISIGEYYKALKKEFSSTKYYQEILRECSYFSTFDNKK